RIRSPLLYPAELLARGVINYFCFTTGRLLSMAGSKLQPIPLPTALYIIRFFLALFKPGVL
ncbi:MAG: hypothetical protein KAI75_05755, partial [Desulfobulbaceae bacterium]|nr:hypothetical protein [Desulfobulbaceae bacterium]